MDTARTGIGARASERRFTEGSDGTFRWTGSSPRKTWVRLTDGDVVSNTVIVPAR